MTDSAGYDTARNPQVDVRRQARDEVKAELLDLAYAWQVCDPRACQAIHDAVGHIFGDES